MLEINCSHCDRLVGKLASKSSLAPSLRFVCVTCVEVHFPDLDRTKGGKRSGLTYHPSYPEMPDFLKGLFGGG